MTFTLAIVGRPNVGKSTLFNRLAGRKLAIVHDRPGVTRDRRYAEAQLGDLAFRIVDTAGFEEAAGNSIEARMRAQTEAAIAEADVTLFVIDAREGLTALDEIFADILRRASTPVIVIANKSESSKAIHGQAEAFTLGFGEPIAVSAEHNLGLDTLYDALSALMEPEPEPEVPVEDTEAAEKPLRIAVVGRPNAGKSSLINQLIGEERFVTAPEAGTTRDALSVDWDWKGRAVKLFDTAGLRKRAKVTDQVEGLSTADSIRAIRFAEAVLLILDVTLPLEKQDLTIADLVIREGRALVIVLNKWDLVRDRDGMKRQIRKMIDDALHQIAGVRIVFVSAMTGEGIEEIMPEVAAMLERWNSRVPTHALNRWLEEALARHAPPIAKGRRLKLRYITQAKTRPPGFVLFTTRPAEVPDDYLRYLINSLRETFGLGGIPIRLLLRKGKNPYADDKS
jgi:GTP-binding protein